MIVPKYLPVEKIIPFNKYSAFFEQWFLLRTRLRRTRGEEM
jgi:hypothetical protein